MVPCVAEGRVEWGVLISFSRSSRAPCCAQHHSPHACKVTTDGSRHIYSRHLHTFSLFHAHFSPPSLSFFVDLHSIATRVVTPTTHARTRARATRTEAGTHTHTLTVSHEAHRAPPRACAHRMRWAGPLHTRGAEGTEVPSTKGGGRRSTGLSRPPTGSSCPRAPVPARCRRSAWRR